MTALAYSSCLAWEDERMKEAKPMQPRLSGRELAALKRKALRIEMARHYGAWAMEPQALEALLLETTVHAHADAEVVTQLVASRAAGRVLA